MKHVKENDLAHGEFGKWLAEVEIHERQAQRLIKVAEELGDEKATTWSDLPFRALYEIATLPPEQRQVPHLTSKGEQKTPDEMTVRELRELKRQLREAEQAKEQAGRFIRIYEELGDSDYVSGRNLGIKALYEIAQLPPEQREIPRRHERQAQRLIKVTEEFGEEGTTSSRLGLNVLYELASLPPEQRQATHTTDKGEGKYATWHNIGIETLYQIATLPPEQREIPHLTSKGELKRQLREAEQAFR